MLHTLALIVAGLALVGILSAVFEQLGLRNHPYMARILAGFLVVIAAYTHTWVRLLIATGVAILCLMLRRDWQKRNERQNQHRTP